MGWVKFMGNELSKQVWNYLSKWFLIQALGRQSDTCFRIPWQIPILCFIKLWKQRIVQPKLNGHVSSFYTRILFITMKFVVSKTMCLPAQKTTCIVCVCSRLRLLTHLKEAAISQHYQGFLRLTQNSLVWRTCAERKSRNCRAILCVGEAFYPSHTSMVP